MDTKKNNSTYDKSVPADYETAISETGFGLFNFMLLIIALPSCLATIYETSTTSYILPSAECDLKLTLMDKGILNAIAYAGMMTSAIFWGYLADTMGRKKLLVSGFILDGICVICGSLSQNVYSFMVFKFLGGCLICGPFAVLLSYLAEFHGTKHRSIIMMILGMFFSTASIILPLLAWVILPKSWNYEFFEKSLVIHSWQIFIAICGLPSLISGICLIFLPESPKFLMSKGRNDEALKVLQLVFKINTRKNKDEYPIKSLIQEDPETKIFTVETLEKNLNSSKINSTNDKKKSSLDALRLLKPMFQQPYLKHSIHVYSIQFCILLGLNTLRLWLPQLFTSIEHFESDNARLNSTDSSSLCTMLEYGINRTNVNLMNRDVDNCEVKAVDKMYMNTMIVGISGLGAYLVAGALINAIGNKMLLVIGLMISGLAGIALYWAQTSFATLILSTIFVAVGSIGSTSLLGVIVNLFPTSLRTMIVSLAMMFGRSGALIGNLLFPFFMSLGCFPPFVMIGSVMMIGSFLCFFLPITHKLALK